MTTVSFGLRFLLLVLTSQVLGLGLGTQVLGLGLGLGLGTKVLGLGLGLDLVTCVLGLGLGLGLGSQVLVNITGVKYVKRFQRIGRTVLYKSTFTYLLYSLVPNSFHPVNGRTDGERNGY